MRFRQFTNRIVAPGLNTMLKDEVGQELLNAQATRREVKA